MFDDSFIDDMVNDFLESDGWVLKRGSACDYISSLYPEYTVALPPDYIENKDYYSVANIINQLSDAKGTLPEEEFEKFLTFCESCLNKELDTYSRQVSRYLRKRIK
jgi:hypothetical protein